MQRLIIAGIMLALMAQVGWGEGETTPCGTASGSDTDYTITPCNLKNNEVFNMVVIGDSIAWGAGLKNDKKYSHLVANWLSEQLSRPVNVKVLAHTGATLSMESSDPIRPPDLSSGNPTAFQQADTISNPDDVDLVLVSAGINDVKVDDIIKLDHIEGPIDNAKNWWKKGEGTCSVAEIRERSDNLQSPMHFLLHKLLQECPNARIVATGYYPIISDDSKGLTDTIKALYPESQQIGDYQNLDEPNQKRQLVEKSNAFYENSTRSLKAAVNDAKSDYGNDHVAFAQIEFNSDNSYGADQSLLWKIDNLGGQIRTDDNMFDTRVLLLNDLGWVCACEQCITPPGKEIPQNVDCDLYRWNKFAAVGHPNERGAIKYKEAIVKTISDSWPGWPDSQSPTIEAFDFSSRSLTLGEPLEITCSVSDNGGSGLKQVELWRTQEKDKWPENPIQTTPLAGETGPVFGSFTDSPTAPGKYWYGVHVVDNAGNWNDEGNSNSNGQPSGFEPAEVEVVESALPIVQAFQVTPQSLNLGESFAIDYTVSDSEGSGLAQVELWRMNETSEWQQISTNPLAGETDPVSGSFTDTPIAPGKYWYGVHVVDNAGNWNDEGNSNSNGQPSGFEPAEVEVIKAEPADATFGSTDSNLALKGDIYYLEDGASSLPDFSALSSIGTIYADALNISPRSFDSGFPGVTDRFEWFAIRYTGDFEVGQEGEYGFRLLSDDGSRLTIDDNSIIDNDGQHSPASASGTVHLTKGEHSIEVEYFQGPRYDIALQLFWTPPGGSESIFDGRTQKVVDSMSPVIQSFQVSPLNLAAGEPFSIDYTASDSDGSGLKQVELWRKDESSEWQQISTNPLAGETDSVSGSFTDSPTASGKYWYGVHVVDNAGNWNDQGNSNSNGQPSGFEPAEVEVVESALPIVQAFQVTPQSLNLGESFAIDYTVSDTGGSGLAQVELWRMNETSDWQQISTNPLAGETDPVSGSFTDSPTAPGKYWYGVHVVDNAGNWNDEKNSNTNGQPSSLETVEVEVVNGEAMNDHNVVLSPGWDVFNVPISSGSVTWNVVDDILRVKFEVSGAQPNHKYVLMATFFDPDSNTKLQDLDQIPNWTKYGASVAPRFNCCREGICASGPGEITFGYMNTDSNGDGISQFDFNMPAGLYCTQFSIRIGGECWPGKEDYSGCGVAYRTGNKYGDGFEKIVII